MEMETEVRCGTVRAPQPNLPTLEGRTGVWNTGVWRGGRGVDHMGMEHRAVEVDHKGVVVEQRCGSGVGGRGVEHRGVEVEQGCGSGARVWNTRV